MLDILKVKKKKYLSNYFLHRYEVNGNDAFDKLKIVTTIMLLCNSDQ